MTILPGQAVAIQRAASEDDMRDTLLLEREIRVRNEDTSGYETVGWAAVWSGPARYRPGTPRQIELGAARGVKLSGLIRVPLDATAYVGLRGYAVIAAELEDVPDFVRLVTVTEVLSAPGRRLHQLLSVLDLDFNADQP